VADLLGIKPSSALVLCSRYVEKGFFIRLKKDLYVLKERWQQNTLKDFFQLSNILQVPSYISLMTALSFYEVTTQVQRGVFESVCIKKSARYEIEGVDFNFYKMKKELYFDFIKQEDFFIATKEKAFIDAVYLYSFGKYVFDIDSIDRGKLDMKKIKRLLSKHPDKTKEAVVRICRI
jgi:predicted transcriptional regulator of viral defense system